MPRFLVVVDVPVNPRFPVRVQTRLPRHCDFGVLRVHSCWCDVAGSMGGHNHDEPVRVLMLLCREPK